MGAHFLILASPGVQGAREFVDLWILPPLVIGDVFVVVLFTSLLVLNRLVWKQAVEKPVAEGLARNSPVAHFTDDLLRHKWPVVIALAVLVFLDKAYHVFGGVMESKWVIAGVIVAIFWRQAGDAEAVMVNIVG